MAISGYVLFFVILESFAGSSGSQYCIIGAGPAGKLRRALPNCCTLASTPDRSPCVHARVFHTTLVTIGGRRGGGGGGPGGLGPPPPPQAMAPPSPHLQSLKLLSTQRDYNIRCFSHLLACNNPESNGYTRI